MTDDYEGMSEETEALFIKAQNKVIDDIMYGPIDEPQEGKTFAPDQRIRISAVNLGTDERWIGTLCKVVRSYYQTEYHGSDSAEIGDEICVLVPLEPRPDGFPAIDADGNESWFLWTVSMLSPA